MGLVAWVILVLLLTAVLLASNTIINNQHVGQHKQACIDAVAKNPNVRESAFCAQFRQSAADPGP